MADAETAMEWSDKEIHASIAEVTNDAMRALAYEVIAK